MPRALLASPRIAVLLAAFALIGAPASATAQELVSLARIGPWSDVSGLIGYGPRLWLVNSVKFVDHNSADLYSYDPRDGSVRYERHLFSQDAGDPAIANGLMFWPFEDSRFSVGRGEFMVSDGGAWAWRVLPAGQVFHVHAMLAVENTLFAATSAWRAGMQRSDDGGATWRPIYDHPTEEGDVSRITSLAALGGELHAGLTAWSQDGIKLLRHRDGLTEPVASWPVGRSTRELTPWRGWLYAWNVADGEGALWRTDGTRAEHVAAFDGKDMRALAAARGALFAALAEGSGGTLWRSEDGMSWHLLQTFDHDAPIDLAVYGGRLYMGARGRDGRGALFGPPSPAPSEEALLPGPLPRSPGQHPAARDGPRLVELDRLLRRTESYSRHGAEIRDVVEDLALASGAVTGAALARRLAGPFPTARLLFSAAE